MVDGDFRVQLRTATHLLDPLGVAFDLYGEQNVRVRQLVLPDLEDRLPWEPGYSFWRPQPLLFDPPAAQTAPAPVPGHEPVADWDLPYDPSLGVFTTAHVTEGGLPVLLESHYGDGSWSMVDGVDESTVETGLIQCLHELVERDPSLAHLLAQLPSGHSAERGALGAAWVVEVERED